VLTERLMLAIHAYGTNTGIKSVAGGEHGHTGARLTIPSTGRVLAHEVISGRFTPRDSGADSSRG
jgi:hypothetical protein